MRSPKFQTIRTQKTLLLCTLYIAVPFKTVQCSVPMGTHHAIPVKSSELRCFTLHKIRTSNLKEAGVRCFFFFGCKPCLSTEERRERERERLCPWRWHFHIHGWRKHCCWHRRAFGMLVDSLACDSNIYIYMYIINYNYIYICMYTSIYTYISSNW
jgi:hypothetical protein